MTQITALNTKLVIDGVDYTAYLYDYEIDDELKTTSGNIIKIYLLQSVTSVATFSMGQSVVLTEGTITNTDYAVFRGKVWTSVLQDDQIVLTCKDALNELGGDYFSVTYDINIDPEAGVLSAIASDIITEGGDTPSVVDSGTSIVYNRFRSRDNTRLDRLQVIAKVLNYSLRVDYDNQWIRLEPKGYTSFSTPLVVGSNIFNIPFWEENIEPMRNKIKIKGATEEGTATDTFTGDGSTYTKSLTYTPTGTTKLVNTTTSTTLIRGVAGSVATGDYQVDEDLKQITFSVAPTAGHVISIEYVAQLPKDVEGTNEDSIASTTVTRGEVYTFNDIQNIDDAETRLTQLLNIIGDPFVSTTIQVDRTLNIKPGNTVQVTDPYRSSKSGTYVVLSVKRTYTDPYITVKIGDTDFDIRDFYDSINQRLQLLEDANIVDTTILRQVIQSQGSYVNLMVRYEDQYQRSATATPTYLYWDDVNQGTWDSYDWAPTESGNLTTDGYTLYNRIQGNNTYTELLRDTDFYDSTNSSGTTWNTSTKTVTVTAGEFVTNVIALGTRYTAATLNIGAMTGQFNPAFRPGLNMLAFYNLDASDTQSANGVVDHVAGTYNASANGYTVVSGTDTAMSYAGTDPLNAGGSSAVFTAASLSKIQISPATSLNITGNYLSWCAWIKPSSTTSQSVLISSNGGTPSDDFWIRVNHTSKLFALYSGRMTSPGYHLSNASYSTYDNTWVHIGVNINLSTLQAYLYVNGVLDKTITLTGTTAGTWFSSNPINLGQYLASNYYNGSLAHMRAWNDNLSAADFVNEMNNAYAVKSQNLVFDFPFKSDSTNKYYVVKGPNSVFPTAWKFKGSSEYIKVTTPTWFHNANTQTVAVWVKMHTQTPSSSGYIYSYPASGIPGNQFGLSEGTTGTITANMGNGGNTLITSSGYTANTWHRFVVVRDGVNQRFTAYIDGVLIGTFSQSINAATADNSVYFGCWNGSFNFFNGAIAGVLVTNKAWDASIVAFDYNSGNGVAYAGYTPSPSGTYIEISADGKATWQSLTSGTRAVLTSSTSDGVYLRATANAASTISNVTVSNPSNGEYEIPALELILEE